MQLRTIFRMKLENFLVMIDLQFSVMGYLENALRYTTPPPASKICKDSGLKLLENAHFSSPVEDPAGSVLDAMRFHALGSLFTDPPFSLKSPPSALADYRKEK